MSHTIKNHTKDTWFIAYNQDEGIHHFGLLEVGRELSSGQPILEQFESEEEMGNRLGELKEENGWYDSYISEQLKDKETL